MEDLGVSFLNVFFRLGFPFGGVLINPAIV